jgi:hypothetical protein
MLKEKILYETNLGKLLIGDSYKELKNGSFDEYKGKVNLIITSPPFPLNNKKNMGIYKEKNIKIGLLV